ncbi:MAG TPA: FAD-dependent oxidoreductase [Isosphaeraceae bacterium]
MRHEKTDVVVLGLSIAGAAIAARLAREGRQVTGLDCGKVATSTQSNQKWKHSGLYYHLLPDLARKVWGAFVGMHPLERRHLLRRGANFIAHDEQALREREAAWHGLEIPFHRLSAGAVRGSGVLGSPRAVGGFRTPDSVIDFASLIPDLHTHSRRLGARLVSGATVCRLLREGDAITGVEYEESGRLVRLRCRRCVVALGGWAAELLRGVDVGLPVRHWKSHILVAEGELVSRITAWLDPPRLTLVPYKGHTLFANERRDPAHHGDDRALIPEVVESLEADVAACFPSLRRDELKVAQVRACIKTESAESCGVPGMAVFGESFHRVRGLWVVFPGKASLSPLLAGEVARQIGADHAYAGEAPFPSDFGEAAPALPTRV